MLPIIGDSTHQLSTTEIDYIEQSIRLQNENIATDMEIDADIADTKDLETSAQQLATESTENITGLRTYTASEHKNLTHTRYFVDYDNSQLCESSLKRINRIAKNIKEGPLSETTYQDLIMMKKPVLNLERTEILDIFEDNIDLVKWTIVHKKTQMDISSSLGLKTNVRLWMIINAYQPKLLDELGMIAKYHICIDNYIITEDTQKFFDTHKDEIIKQIRNGTGIKNVYKNIIMQHKTDISERCFLKVYKYFRKIWMNDIKESLYKKIIYIRKDELDKPIVKTETVNNLISTSQDTETHRSTSSTTVTTADNARTIEMKYEMKAKLQNELTTEQNKYIDLIKENNNSIGNDFLMNTIDKKIEKNLEEQNKIKDNIKKIEEDIFYLQYNI